MTERCRSAGWLVLMGGSGPDGFEPRILRRFVELAGGTAEARVVVVPTASEDRSATIERYQNAFELEDVQNIEVLDIRTHHQADLPETLRVLHEATGIMFTGGDQLRLLSILNGTGFAQELRRRSRDGLVVGGSSAGAMALGDPVIIRGEPSEFYEAGEIRQMAGLDVADGLSVDTHLVPRGRLVRLLPVISAHPDRLGLGIDEGCGVTISPEGMLTVVGPGVVLVVDGSAAQSHGASGAEPGAALSVTGLQLHVLSDGDEFDLRARQIVRR
ncbi:MAG TPA: cyanophycinase [Coriobacteriia bacterium]